ncbi:nuclear transport factor 2 family protein [Salicibibacter cibarius]|uniref:Nuclear transport factor 2 family protein n=1 Tax=Salicibibacter cibarius TaxID=2743000 RepID=A0A7T7CDB6_9BACI|nr:nuclear transport factor 2 family protein [Salicibibacter cibarius]QQK77810.1 nuclear transport factor 2 family protein [Salicibibacter cibarius]
MQKRDYLINMAQKKYFQSVDAYDIEGVLECFSDDATFIVRSAQPAKHHGKEEIREMFEELFKSFPNKMIHKDFKHVVDEPNESISSQFNVELISPDNNEIYQTNSNFFYLENGKFKEVHVYMLGQNVLGGKKI